MATLKNHKGTQYFNHKTGEVFTITSTLRDFCKKYNFCYVLLLALSAGRIAHYKGITKLGDVYIDKRRIGAKVVSKKLTKPFSVFLEQANKLHNNKYDYSQANYVNGRTKINIKCPIHGLFSQTPGDHLSTHGCSKCGHKIGGSKHQYTTKDFIAKATKKHGGIYTYENTRYTKSTEKVLVTCNYHGDFLQSATFHLQGGGCPDCCHKGWTRTSWIAHVNNRGIKTSYIYVLKLQGNGEIFYKLGLSSNPENRIKYGNFPYNVELLKAVPKNSIDAWDIEKTLLRKFRNNKYIPKLRFDGETECFTKLNLKQIK